MLVITRQMNERMGKCTNGMNGRVYFFVLEIMSKWQVGLASGLNTKIGLASGLNIPKHAMNIE